jgi:dynein heavy chain 1
MALGNIKASSEMREITKHITSNTVPPSWQKYPIISISLNEWLLDFKKRLEQLNAISNSGDYGKRGIWLGGLFYPEAFMTATRQSVAQE